MPGNAKFVAGVYLVLEKNEQVLFMRRVNTGYQAGMYMLPGGGVEEEEPPTAATIREAQEELGIHLNEKDLQPIHVMFRGAHDSTGSRTDIFLKTNKWEGEPVIKEPNKCEELKWFSLKDLPESIPLYVRTALNNYKENIIYSEFDWDI